MRKTFIAAALATLASGSWTAPASAFGDRCIYPGVTARGSAQPSMGKAYAAARSAWEAQTARQHGKRYADWWYSGDRTFDCSWNNSGSKIVCVAYAAPCGRKR